MKLYLFGDSHVVALGKALQARPDPTTILDGAVGMTVGKLWSFPTVLKPFFESAGDHVALISRKATDELAATYGAPALATSDEDTIFALSLPYTTSIMLWTDTWRTARPWRLADRRRHALSDAVMSAMVLDHYQHVFGFLADMRERTPRIFVVEAPPVRSDDRAILTSRLEEDSLIAVDAEVREIVDRKLRELGVDVVPAPESAYVGERRRSPLKPALHNIAPNDHHHANAEFGEAHLRDIEAYLSAKSF